MLGFGRLEACGAAVRVYSELGQIPLCTLTGRDKVGGTTGLHAKRCVVPLRRVGYLERLLRMCELFLCNEGGALFRNSDVHTSFSTESQCPHIYGWHYA